METVRLKPTLIEKGIYRIGGRRYDKFLCPYCGNTFIARSDILSQSHKSSCGCMTIQLKIEHCTKHGMHRTVLYRRWESMKHRVASNADCHRPHYKGKGVIVCDEWQTFEPFMEWSLANGFSKELEIDRIDNNGNYCPENCRWTTASINMRNTSRTKLNETKIIELLTRIQRGESIKSIAKSFGCSQSAIQAVIENRRWQDITSSITIYKKIRIMSVRYYIKIHGIKKSDYVNEHQLKWIKSALLENGFKIKSIKLKERIKNINKLIRENYPELIKKASLIIWSLYLRSKNNKRVELYYK